MKLVFDIEANGLYDATKIWCIVAKDIETGQTWEFGPKDLDEGARLVSSADTLIGHNIIDYDLPTLDRILGTTLVSNYLSSSLELCDTLLVSRLLNPDRTVPQNYKGKGGPHSLEAWGYRVNRGKPDHTDWTQFSEEMLTRCKEDVEINTLTYFKLCEEMGDHDWSEAIGIEQRVGEIISRQARSGVYFDTERARQVVAHIEGRLQEIDEGLDSLLPVRWKPHGVEVKKPFKKDGTHTRMVTDWFESDATELVNGPFTRIYSEKLNLNSDKQVKELLFSLGWKPVAWNYKPTGERSSPKLEFADDESDGLEGRLAKLLKERKLLSHRKSQFEGWIRNVREDHRLSARANTCGTNTGRFRHSIVVNVPKAQEYVPLGYEMRSCFTSTPGRYLLGYDAEQIELRLLAHYMNDKDYIDAILSGDIHSYNQELAGLPTRDDAKTFIYAFNYGAGDAKLGNIVGGSANDGKRLRKEFLESCPSLDKLIRGVKRAAGRGYLVGLDGRKLWMRRSDDGRIQRNKALNTLLQGAGAVVMKKSMVLLDDWVREEKLDAFKVLDMHDEAQWDVHPDHVERMKELSVQCIVKAGEHFNLNIPLAADVKVGHTWATTH